jgi:hypothetical protein
MSAVKINSALGLNLLFHSAIYNRKCAYLSFGNSTPPQLASAQWSLFRLWQLENEEMTLRNLRKGSQRIGDKNLK